MKLLGSCHCNKIQFEVESHTPVPYMRCYCSICRKVGSGAPYGSNIMGLKSTLKLLKEDSKISKYQAVMDREAPESEQELAGNVRHFCSNCSSNLWAYDKKHADWVYPCASAIDTPLPKPEKTVHIMLGSKASWTTEIKPSDQDDCFEQYPNESIENWHKNNKQWVE